MEEFLFLPECPHLVQHSVVGGPLALGDEGRESLVLMRSAFTATSKELGGRELFRLEPWIVVWGTSSCWTPVIEERLLPTGVLLLDIHTPSISMPLSMARIPKGISFFFSSRCDSSMSGVGSDICACFPFSTLV